MATEEETRKIAERLAESLMKQMQDVEVLGDLHMPIRDVLGMIADLQANMERRDFAMIMLILSMMYDLDEKEFMSRLAKTVITMSPELVESNVKITSE